MNIAFLTLENPEGFVIYDSLCIPEFQKLNIKLIELPWTMECNWSQFDMVIIRSTWDYQKHWKKFIEVLKIIENQTLLANSLKAVLWNVNKKYLKELKNVGFSIVNSYFIEGNLSETLFLKLKTLWNSKKLVIKPQISANADNTFVLEFYENYSILSHHFKETPCIIQPYLKEIETFGEISLFYFDGLYSHAVRKMPKNGDFRVQEEHGGLIYGFEPNQTLKSIGSLIVNYLDSKFGDLLFVRIDLVRHHRKWKIMEIELIEPSLYFPYHDKAIDNFVKATVSWYKKRASR